MSGMSSGNWQLILVGAVSRAVAAGEDQQLADANTAEFEVGAEDKVYNSWTTTSGKTLSQLAKAVESAPQSQVAQCQAAWNLAQTDQQQQVKQIGAGSDAAQNQVSTDSTNNQQKASLVAAITSAMQAESNSTFSSG